MHVGLKYILVLLILFGVIAISVAQEVEGMAQLSSNYSVKETLDRLETLLTQQGLTVFARIDFTADARAAGLTMHQAELLIFGNPKVGTPLMIEQATIAIDLPLKALVWETDDGIVLLGWNEPAYIAQRHGISDSLVAPTRGVVNLFRKATE